MVASGGCPDDDTPYTIGEVKDDRNDAAPGGDAVFSDRHEVR